MLQWSDRFYHYRAFLLLALAGCCLFIPLFFLIEKIRGPELSTIDADIPLTWSDDYTESEEAYATQWLIEDWSTVKPDVNEEFTSVTLVDITAKFDEYEVFETNTLAHRTAEDIRIAQLTESEAWTFISNGIWSEYPTASFSVYKDKLVELKNTNTETIDVRCWYWVNPDDDTDMRKTTIVKTFAVNSKLADTFRHIFEDIYADPSQPIINIADLGMGTWVIRGKNHNSNNTMSAHSLGCAIDINPSTGSFYVNGVWYGNAYGQQKMTESIWYQLPECHKKYHVLYENCPIVNVFKAYGFYWGGDWNSTKDCMHLSYIGDGSSARQTGINNYRNSKY